MSLIINGIGTTIAPIPPQGQYSLATEWISFFIPIFPLGFSVIKGGDSRSTIGWSQKKYTVIEKLSYADVAKKLGTKNMLLALARNYILNAWMLVVFAIGFAYVKGLFLVNPALAFLLMIVAFCQTVICFWLKAGWYVSLFLPLTIFYMLLLLVNFLNPAMTMYMGGVVSISLVLYLWLNRKCQKVTPLKQDKFAEELGYSIKYYTP